MTMLPVMLLMELMAIGSAFPMFQKPKGCSFPFLSSPFHVRLFGKDEFVMILP